MVRVRARAHSGIARLEASAAQRTRPALAAHLDACDAFRLRVGYLVRGRVRLGLGVRGRLRVRSASGTISRVRPASRPPEAVCPSPRHAKKLSSSSAPRLSRPRRTRVSSRPAWGPACSPGVRGLRGIRLVARRVVLSLLLHTLHTLARLALRARALVEPLRRRVARPVDAARLRRLHRPRILPGDRFRAPLLHVILHLLAQLEARDRLVVAHDRAVSRALPLRS